MRGEEGTGRAEGGKGERDLWWRGGEGEGETGAGRGWKGKGGRREEKKGEDSKVIPLVGPTQAKKPCATPGGTCRSLYCFSCTKIQFDVTGFMPFSLIIHYNTFTSLLGRLPPTTFQT